MCGFNARQTRIEQWKKHAAREARLDALMIGFGAWALVAILFSSGWLVFFRAGMAAYQSYSGTFWTRLPIIALGSSPLILVAFRIEKKRSLRKAENLTVARNVTPRQRATRARPASVAERLCQQAQ
jgi:hypothetical protein